MPCASSVMRCAASGSRSAWYVVAQLGATGEQHQRAAAQAGDDVQDGAFEQRLVARAGSGRADRWARTAAPRVRSRTASRALGRGVLQPEPPFDIIERAADGQRGRHQHRGLGCGEQAVAQQARRRRAARRSARPRESGRHREIQCTVLGSAGGRTRSGGGARRASSRDGRQLRRQVARGVGRAGQRFELGGDLDDGAFDRLLAARRLRAHDCSSSCQPDPARMRRGDAQRAVVARRRSQQIWVFEQARSPSKKRGSPMASCSAACSPRSSVGRSAGGKPQAVRRGDQASASGMAPVAATAGLHSRSSRLSSSRSPSRQPSCWVASSSRWCASSTISTS